MNINEAAYITGAVPDRHTIREPRMSRDEQYDLDCLLAQKDITYYQREIDVLRAEIQETEKALEAARARLRKLECGR